LGRKSPIRSGGQAFRAQIRGTLHRASEVAFGSALGVRRSKHSDGEEPDDRLAAEDEAAMSIITDIGNALEMFAQSQKSEGRHVVTTQYLYPSNGHVSVYVTPGLAGNLAVSDGGGAIDTLTAHGIDATDHKRVFSPVRNYKGLVVESGEIKAKRLPNDPDLLGTAIITVARAAAEVAEHGVRNLRPRKARNLEDELLHYCSATSAPHD
jgi:hypothetical protein